MKVLIRENQLEIYKHVENFRKNHDNILNDLLSNPEFFEDLKDHSYNKNNYVNWWKIAKEDFYDLASRKYCGLLKDVLSKYKLWEKLWKPKDFGFSDYKERQRYSCKHQFEKCLDYHFDWLRGYPYEGDDGPRLNKNVYGVPDISKHFMETFYGK